MKRKLLAMLAMSVVLLSGTTSTNALHANGTGSSSSSSSTSSSSSSSGSSSAIPSAGVDDSSVDKDEGGGGGVTIVINCKCNPLDQYNVYAPKITCIHNLNALFASVRNVEDGEDKAVAPDVYYIPTLESLPFDLKNFIIGLGEEDKNGFRKSKFSLVYDGFFNSETEPFLYDGSSGRRDTSAGITGRAHTSKSVSTQYNDKALEMIGYDLLLKKEVIKARASGGGWEFTYTATPAGTDVLTAQVAAMDIYKAVGAFEYDVTYAFGEDEEFDANTSPILQSLGFLTDKNSGEQGFDVSEGMTYVGVTRTIPRLYWERYTDDGINLGVTDLDKNDLSTIYHMAAPIQSSTKINMLQFCNMAVAIMNLYGESAISPEEELQFQQTCSRYLLNVPEATQVELDSLKYLIIKGIIKPQDLKDVDWQGGCHLYSVDRQDIPTNYVLGMLGRIADKDSRFSMPEPESDSQELLDAGFMETNITTTDATSITQANTNSRLAYDYLIEITDKTANYLSPRNIEEKEDTNAGDETDKMDSLDQLDVTHEENKGTFHGTNIAHVADVMKHGVNILYDIDGTPYFLDTGSIVLDPTSELKPAMSPSQLDSFDDSDPTAGIKPRYYYYGVVEFGGKYFYHFKFNQKAIDQLGSVKFTFETYSKKYKSVELEHVDDEDGLDDIRVKDLSQPNSFTLGGSTGDGGVYALVNGQWKQHFFSDLNFSEEFIDSSRYVAAPMAAKDYSTLIFYMNEDQLEGNKKGKGKNGAYTWAEFLKNIDAGKIDWHDMIDNKNTGDFYDKAVPINNEIGAEMFAYGLRPAARSEKDNGGKDIGPYIRVEVITDNPDAVLDSNFVKRSLKKATDGVESLKGYYRQNSEDGKSTLLVSIDYLKQNDIISDFTKVADGVYCMISNKYDNNIIINVEHNLIIVGNTVFAVNELQSKSGSRTKLEKDKSTGIDKEILYTKVGNKEYVNYRACFGWSGDFSILADNNESGVMATSPGMYGIEEKLFGDSKLEYGVEEVMTYMPSSTTKTMTIDMVSHEALDKDGNWIMSGNKIKANGILMTGTYALAPYLIVHHESALEKDYLFVWHFNDVMDSAGDNHKITQATSKNSLEVLKNLLGIEIKAQKGYRLVYYELDKQAEAEDNAGFKYVQIHNQSIAAESSWGTATLGWVYEPPKFKVQDAIDTYAKTGAKKGHKLEKGDLAIPIFSIDKWFKSVKYGDANVNTCSEDKAGDRFSLGTMPCTFSNSVKNGLVVVKNDGSMKKANKKIAGDAYGEDTSNYYIWTAPVALFNQIKALGFNEVQSLDNVSVYYGTAACNATAGKLTIKGTSTAVETKSEAIVAYKGSSKNSLYVINDGVNYLKDFMQEVETKLEFLLSESSQVVDWDKYSFNRLVANLDSISSIVYLFILSVVPRIAEFLFFILILLSLIVDFKPWQKLCRNWFDIYDALTMGHQNVDTINTKTMVLVSCWALALFIMIEGGTLFNFIIWISKSIVEIYQH